eukprot:5720421-Pleurochrysis_carterae.AAC.1
MVGVKLWAKPYSYSYVFDIDRCSIFNFRCGRVDKHGSMGEPHMCQAHGTFKVGCGRHQYGGPLRSWRYESLWVSAVRASRL